MIGHEVFAERLREIRKAAGLTQDELAEKSGVPQSSISRLEKPGTIPPWDVVVALAKTLGVSCQDFLEEPGAKEKKPAKKEKKA